MSSGSSSTMGRVALIVVSLLIGGIGGYCVRSMSAASASTVAPGSGGGGMGRGGGGMGRGGGMGGGGQASSATMLPRLVHNLAVMEKVQNKGLTADQSQKLLPILQQLQSPDKMSEQDAKTKLDSINAVLTPDQTQALQELQPARGGGGRGGGPGMGGPGGGRGMGGGGGGGFGMGGGMGQRPDPDHPFASERNKQSLTDLIAALQSSPAKQ